MEKYHITDKGEVKTCTAHVRKCPINDAPMHFSNKEDAYEHIANTVNNSAILTKKNESMISQRDKKKKIQAFVELNKILEKSSRGFGYHVSNDGLEEINPDKRTENTDFTYLGGGMVRDAYYHQKTNLVYKVNRFFTDEESRRFALHEKRAYDSLNHEELWKKKVRYADTDFIETPDGRIFVTQEAILAENLGYHPTKFSSAHDEMMSHSSGKIGEIMGFLKDNGITDLQMGNVVYDKNKDEIILIDCLPIEDDLLAKVREENDKAWQDSGMDY